MSSKILGIVIAFLLLVAGGSAFLLMKPDSMDISPIGTNQSSSSESEQPAATPSGQYVNYSEAAVASTKGTKLLFFHAPWCPQCRALERSIKEGSIPENVTIFKVDYDSNQPLRQKYGVAIQTTLVRIDDQGNEVEKFVAYDEPTLENVLKNLL